MANYLPPGAIPSISRLKRGGKEVGNFGCLIRGKRVNLGTQDYFIARERARAAHAGLPWEQIGAATVPVTASASADWTQDVAEAVARTPDPEPTPQDEFASSSSTIVDEPPSPPDEERPDYIPPPDASSEDEPMSEAPRTTALPANWLKDMVGQAAVMLTEIQLWGQEWLIKRYGGVQPGQIPQTGKAAISREIGVELWTAAIESIAPKEIDLPPYILAPILIALTSVPVQLANAEPLPETPTTPAQ